MSRKLDGVAFATQYTARPHYYAPEGSRMHNDYEITIDKRGHKVLKCVGEHDIYEEIQSYAEECKIENILARAAAGDAAALNQRSGFYADITESPANLAEAQNAILKLAKVFDSLPAEVRAKFDNSKEVFVNQYGTEDFINNMGWNDKAEKTEEINFVPETNNDSTKILTPEVKA